MSDDFKKPLDQYIEETQEVERPAASFNPETQKVSVTKVKEKVRIVTRYTRASQYATICRAGTHSWTMLDKHKHIIACTGCPKRRFYRAAYEKIDPAGHLLERDSGILLD